MLNLDAVRLAATSATTVLLTIRDTDGPSEVAYIGRTADGAGEAQVEHGRQV
jgi:hypothetical protein